jgi:hypothetical protein
MTGADMRVPFPTLLLTLLLAAPVLAAQPAPPADAQRFQLAPGDSGVTRIDTATGAITHCVERNDRWTCQPVTPGVLPPATTTATAPAQSAERTLATKIVGRLFAMVKALKHPHAG